ncbi:MAG: extensin family protein [Rhizobiales bacterium]|nr:extensin family protein [Hyphomicrobiales bacterium]
MKSIKQRTTAQPSTKSVVVTPRKTAPARITRALRKAPLPRARPWLANDAGTTQRPNLINSFKKFRTAKATKKTATKLAEEAPTKTTEATIGGVLSRARQKPRGGPLVLVKLSKSAMRSSCPKRSLVGIQAVNAPTRVRLSPQANVQRQLGFALANWVRDVVQTEASRHLGSPVVKLRVAASFSCRTRNGVKGAKLSEHGLGNAIDISEFTLADGRKINVAKGWKGRRPERKFLRAVNEGACKHFTTVLGPNADRFHRDHFHLDLARHGQAGAYRVCK